MELEVTAYIPDDRTFYHFSFSSLPPVFPSWGRRNCFDTIFRFSVDILKVYDFIALGFRSGHTSLSDGVERQRKKCLIVYVDTRYLYAIVVIHGYVMDNPPQSSLACRLFFCTGSVIPYFLLVL